METKILPYFLDIVLYDDLGEEFKVTAKVDSGADNCSVDEAIAKKLGLSDQEDILAEAEITNANGVDTRPVIEIEFELDGVKIKTVATVADRSDLDAQLLIGRNALESTEFRFLIDPLKKLSRDLKKLSSYLKTNKNMNVK